MNSITTRQTTLPARRIQLTEQLGNVFLSTMKKIGKPVTFDNIVLGSRFAAYFIDASRLSFPVTHLEKPDVSEHLMSATKFPVYVLRGANGGMMFAVDYEPPCELPSKINLSLSDVNNDNMLVPIGHGTGHSRWMKLQEMGHTLIVGMTGSGKSVWLHSALAALLCKNSPDKLKIALADAKRSEMVVWANTPHNLFGGVTYDVGDTEAMLQKIIAECDRRGELFSSVGARHIETYNEQAEERLPYILVVLDEGLDLLAEAGQNSDLSLYLRKIGMRGRSAGVFVWLATQHSTALSGIPRTLALNMMTRIVFRVADGAAARNAGCPQAHNLPKIPGRLMLMGKRDVFQAYHIDDNTLQELANSISIAPNDTQEKQIPDNWLDVLRYAVSENGGLLNDEHIKSVLDISRNAARRMVRAMLNEGLLFKDTMNGNAITVSELAMELL